MPEAFLKIPSAPTESGCRPASSSKQVGAKQLTVGGAAVYHGHGNFLYNRGDATAADVRRLAAILKAQGERTFRRGAGRGGYFSSSRARRRLIEDAAAPRFFNKSKVARPIVRYASRARGTRRSACS